MQRIVGQTSQTRISRAGKKHSTKQSRFFNGRSALALPWTLYDADSDDSFIDFAIFFAPEILFHVKKGDTQQCRCPDFS
tara:strand:- start:574 stop:810 length:237 start_codon:yes stop_codon:yes gene_type:complete